MNSQKILMNITENAPIFVDYKTTLNFTAKNCLLGKTPQIRPISDIWLQFRCIY